MRNFIRGMGTGILAATVILAIAYMVVGKDISDEEIKARAKKLGMEEQEQSVVIPKNEQEEPAKQDAQEPADINPETEPEAPEQGQEPVQQSQEMETAQPVAAQQESSEEVTAEQGQITVQIESGMDGVTISYMLQDKGIVDDAMAFNRYLASNKLQMKLRPGIYELKPGMSYEEAANKITH